MCKLALFLVLSGASHAASESCSLGWVCVEPRVSGEEIDLIAVNLKPWPLALSVRADVRNLEASPADEVTISLEGGESKTAIKLQPADSTGRRHYSYRYDWTVGSLEAIHDDRVVYQLPYANGESWRVLQGYGSKFSHTGLERYTVDFDMPVGTPVLAARDGVIVRTKDSNDRSCWDAECGRYANFVVILHDDETTGEYYHLMKDGVVGAIGDRVVAGQVIAYSGNTGKSTMPHLHFGVYRAAPWGKTESIPVRFETSTGLLDRPKAGRRYQRP
ncbi:MAG: M23 family metallopeptidase [Gammaproteobacteria bacterium]